MTPTPGPPPDVPEPAGIPGTPGAAVPPGTTAAGLLTAVIQELSPDADANRLLPRIAAGEAPREVFAAFVLEQRHILASDRRSFRHLARRSHLEPPVASFFHTLAEGEALALGKLEGLAAACALSRADLAAHEPRAGCQAYPSYVAWLALGAEPVDVVIALTANFAAWGSYCATVARAMRERYAFPDDACGFFDFFAEPDPALAERARAAVEHGLAAGRVTPACARRYGRLLQSYEIMFWSALSP
ncbi:transcriptional regulator [Streptomyces sp. MST-110588]|uniref:transcriptional regulator n=1 Tax=Streptomyces sp. MST-110588 TaxID=2833628 RepID=UPI001F5DC2A2|nr:transcriptional regulator [Streptomyces sp. MST-110588]UNO39333.1 transcriptional regulator [Streptomyces sp. MST-110588]